MKNGDLTPLSLEFADLLKLQNIECFIFRFAFNFVVVKTDLLECPLFSCSPPPLPILIL